MTDATAGAAAPGTAVAGEDAARPVPGEHVPGEPGLWIVILGDMTVFGVLFGAFLVDRHHAPGVFAASRHELAVAAGAVNTLILLTSSLLVARLVQRHRAGDAAGAARLTLGAIACGLAFVTVKGLEWGHLFAGHHDPGENSFFTWFFVLTGLHLLHLLLGLAGLTVLRRVVRREERRPSDRFIVEGVASYWHMVDLLWLVIFPLTYLSAT